MVLFTRDLAATSRFYEEVLGFVISDRYPGRGHFLRGAAAVIWRNEIQPANLVIRAEVSPIRSFGPDAPTLFVIHCHIPPTIN